MKIAIAVSAALTWLALPSTSFAGCHVFSYSFDPYLNDHVSPKATTNDGTCSHMYRPADLTVFTSSSIVVPPRHGILKKTGAYIYEYAATAGYKGVDTYTTKVCGYQRSQRGCSLISYTVTMK